MKNATAKEAPSFLDQVEKVVPQNDKLEELKKLIRQYRDDKFEVDNILQSAQEKNKALNELKRKIIPEFMQEIGVPSITLEAEGNYPAFTTECKPFYAANIAADWPPELREAAFEYIEKLGYGELIKTFVTFAFPRELQKTVVPFLKNCKDMEITVTEKDGSKTNFKLPVPEVQRTIHPGTLAKWLREQVEKGGAIPDLDKIGGFVGVVADVKEVKERKVRAKR